MSSCCHAAALSAAYSQRGIFLFFLDYFLACVDSHKENYCLEKEKKKKRQR